LWYTKSRRAQNDEDYETWIEGGVMPTLNAFDNGDIRTTVLIMRNREGKPGGGKGPMLGEKSFTLATNNDQTLFIFYGNRVDDLRLQGGVINTLQARMGTGGNNMPMVFSHTQGLDPQPSEEVSPTLRRNGNGMAALNEAQVRRLTPLECERLQGFPDEWTTGQSDSARYKQMGNAVAVPVVEWIIQGIVDTLI